MLKDIVADDYLDLRGFICPMNFVKCCLTLEKLGSNQVLKVDLDIGESEKSVIEGLKDKGYKVEILNKDSKSVSLLISSESN
tara:strand:+ start:229 stop:474 length:246 start_codon:yes stop_codon:yes gene_type:complete